jgi:CHAD domain-containing protein
VEQENDQTLESAQADTATPTAAGQAPAAVDARQSLTRLLRNRVKKFVALVPQVRADGDPKIIHDVRVRSRRLQQALDALFAKPRPGKVRRLRRVPRRFRRTLGEWRNCDVLLDIVARQQRRARSQAKRQAWEFVRDYLAQKRAKEVARACKKLQRENIGGYAERVERVVNQASAESAHTLLQRLDDSVQEASIAWQSALARAQESRAADDLHAFRIATKVLRYRTELLYDVGAKPLKTRLKWLAKVQDAIGVWHDRQVLNRTVAEALARAQVLLNEMPTVRLLLTELEKDRGRQADEVKRIFRSVLEPAENHQIESSSENNVPADQSRAAEAASEQTSSSNQEDTQ